MNSFSETFKGTNLELKSNHIETVVLQDGGRRPLQPGTNWSERLAAPEKHTQLIKLPWKVIGMPGVNN